jgi:hypothetical protein
MVRTGPNAGTTNYVWDNESRLVSVGGQTSASYTYNGADARVTANDGQNRTFRRDGTSVTSPVLSDGHLHARDFRATRDRLAVHALGSEERGKPHGFEYGD